MESLAEAIVLEQAPELVYKSMEHVKEERKEKKLKQLIYRERMQRTYQKISNALSNPNKGLSKVDIPDKRAAHVPEYGDPTKPKDRKGPWILITQPEQIAAVICDINLCQYHQAHNMPFGSGVLASMVGRRGNTTQAMAIINGVVPDPLPMDLMPETVRIIHSLAQPVPATAAGTGLITED